MQSLGTRFTLRSSAKDEENNNKRNLFRSDTIIPPEDTSETRQQYRLMTKNSYQTTPVLPHQLDQYDSLFEACWTGDNAQIQELCLPLKPKADVQPIQIAVQTSPFADPNSGSGYGMYGSDGSYTPLAVAVLARKWDTARLVLAIASAQHHKEEIKHTEFTTRHINLSMSPSIVVTFN